MCITSASHVPVVAVATDEVVLLLLPRPLPSPVATHESLLLLLLAVAHMGFHDDTIMG